MGRHQAGPRDWEPSPAPVPSAYQAPPQEFVVKPTSTNADDAITVREIYIPDVLPEVFYLLWLIIKFWVWLLILVPFRILRWLYRKLFR